MHHRGCPTSRFLETKPDILCTPVLVLGKGQRRLACSHARLRKGKLPRCPWSYLTTNDANNYLASIIGQDAAQEVLNQVNPQIAARTVGTVLSGLTDAGAGLEKAADGAEQLAGGLSEANDGATQLATGSEQLAVGLRTARDGSAQAREHNPQGGRNMR